jgi:hypothetical protein
MSELRRTEAELPTDDETEPVSTESASAAA